MEFEEYSLYNKRWMDGNYYPKVEAYYFREWQNFNMEIHTHKRIEIMYIINGHCTIEILGQTFNLKSGEFTLIDSEVNHRLLVKEDPCRMLNIEFTFFQRTSPLPCLKHLKENIQSMQFLLNSEEKYLVLKDNGDIYVTIKNCIFEMDKTGQEAEFMQQLLLQQLFIRIAQLYKSMSLLTEPSFNDYVKKAQNYIMLNYDYDISVKDIADILHIHPGYLHRIFKKILGITIMQYINNIRIDKSKMLLSNTDSSITDISSYVGINSLQYFTAVFKKSTGLTPLQYRRSVSKNNFYKG